MTHPGSVKHTLATILNGLDSQARTILELRFGLYGHDRTLEEVGAECGLTREKVRRIEAETLKQLRASFEPTLWAALGREGEELKTVLISEHGLVRQADLPRERDLSPWSRLALLICDLSAAEWLEACLGQNPDPAC